MPVANEWDRRIGVEAAGEKKRKAMCKELKPSVMTTNSAPGGGLRHTHQQGTVRGGNQTKGGGVN